MTASSFSSAFRPTSPEYHRFNDDLLVSEEDRAYAHRHFQSLVHVLDHKALRHAFKSYDDPANEAKQRSHKTGRSALAMTGLALLCAASEPLWGGIPGRGAALLGLTAAVLGVLGTAIGWFGVLHSRRKRDWLYQRMMAERLRQFHFQTLVRQMPEVVGSMRDDSSRAAFEQKRAAWLQQFLHDHDLRTDARYTELVAVDSEPDPWLIPASADSITPDDDLLEPIFDAYRRLRIRHQLDYALHKIRSGGPGRSLADQSSAFHNVWVVLLAAVLSAHLIVGGYEAVQFVSGHGSEHVTTDSDLSVGALDLGGWLHMIAVALALGAVLVRTAEDGLGIRDELARYRAYASAVRGLDERYQAADRLAPAHRRREKLRVMEELERLSFEEMRSFLRNHDDATFVM